MKRVSVFLITVALIAGMVPGMAGCGGTPSGGGIRDWYDLDVIRDDMSGNHLLMNDLDSSTVGYDEVAGPAANGGKGWEPIGTAVVADVTDVERPYPLEPFGGSFDGQGYEIRDLFIHRPDEDLVGLFGYVSEGGGVSDIGVAKVVVSGRYYIGALVGCNDGTVVDSYSGGSVTGEKHVGGLVGYDSGNTVSNSYYNHEESLINGENMITTGALSDEAFEEWLAGSKFLDVSERLSFEDGYYLIESVGDFKELLAFGQNATLRFRLTSDLDLGSDPNFYIPYLAGEFDGDGHIISNVSLHNDAVYPLALFAHLVSGGSITGLGVENVHMTGWKALGGLVGYNQGTVRDSYAASNISGIGFIGGLVGYIEYDGDVSNSYSTGNVSGMEYVGGLAGHNSGPVSNSCSTVNVVGIEYAGGLAGHSLGTVSNSYSIGNVLGMEHVGGLVGHMFADGTVHNSFWDIETSGQSTSAGGTGRTTAEMQGITTFSGATWDMVAVANPSTRNPSYIWNIVDDETYPFLNWQSDVPVYEGCDGLALLITSTDGGDVTEPGEAVFTYDEGTVVNLVATPDTGYSFRTWIGGVTTIADVNAATTSITMDNNYGICAIFASPIEVYDWYDLDAVRSNLYSDCFLMNNLDSTTAGYDELASSTANGGQGWEPIADFGGRFDGQGYEIRDLSINCPSPVAYVGFFRDVSSSGVIKNVGLVSVTVTTEGYGYVGALVAFNDGTISNSYAAGAVSGGYAVGGLVGRNYGTVSDSYADCSVTSDDACVGGVVGDNRGGTVSNSFSVGNVIGYSHVGGLVGQNCFGADVSNSYSIGNVFGVENVGGLVGASIESTVTNSFWNIETSGQDTSDGGTGKVTAEMQDFNTFSGATWDIVAVANPSTSNPSYIWNIVDDETYPFLNWQSNVPVYEEPDGFWLLITSTDGGDVTEPGDGVFTYDEGMVVNLAATPDAGYSFCGWTGHVSTIADVNSATTSITMNDSYVICAIFGDPEIRDWYDLDAIRDNTLGHYILMNDLDSTTAGYGELASPTANQGKGWEPIGDFVGRFDGQGYEIRDLFINRPIETSVGLFQGVGTGGVIENVGVVNVNVTGKHHVGGLVGDSEGDVSNSYSTGSVTGYEAAGGLVGESGADEGNAGTISNSYSNCSVNGELEKIGGLVGDNKGTVSNSYATGSVTGNSFVGGLVGYNRYTVSNSYSTGSVTGDYDVGGLVGSDSGGTVTNSFWDTETSGQATSAGGTGKTTTEMQDISTFSGAAWDIIGVANPDIRNLSYIWNIVDDEIYPFLSWEPVS